MRRGSAAAVLALALGGVQTMAPAKTAPARDGNVAIAEELCAARAKATVAAYDLFIARHPKHPLAATARQERARIAGGRTAP